MKQIQLRKLHIYRIRPINSTRAEHTYHEYTLAEAKKTRTWLQKQLDMPAKIIRIV